MVIDTSESLIQRRDCLFVDSDGSKSPNIIYRYLNTIVCLPPACWVSITDEGGREREVYVP